MVREGGGSISGLESRLAERSKEEVIGRTRVRGAKGGRAREGSPEEEKGHLTPALSLDKPLHNGGEKNVRPSWTENNPSEGNERADGGAHNTRQAQRPLVPIQIQAQITLPTRQFGVLSRSTASLCGAPPRLEAAPSEKRRETEA